MQKSLFYTLATLLLLTACNTNTPSAISVKGKIYKHPPAVQYLKFATDSVYYYGDFGNETLNNKAFAYTQKDEVVTVFTPTPEHLLAYEGFVLRNGQQYELFADTSDPNYQDHQPADPATWSPAGNKYWTQNSTWADTLEFVTAFKVLYYSRPEFYKICSYTLDYPAIKITMSTSYYLGEFRDTTSLRLSGIDYEIIK